MILLDETQISVFCICLDKIYRREQITTKEEVRNIRKEKGLTASEISKITGIPSSTITGWIKGISLTEEQQLELQNRLPTYKRGKFAAQKYSEQNRVKRETARNLGRTRFQNICNRDLLVAGVCLYWGEGTKKQRNTISFCNSDSSMILLFLRFLKEIMEIKDSDIKIKINCYTDLHTQQEIENYWLNITGLPKEKLGKTVTNNKPISSKGTKKCEFGTCTLDVYDTYKMQELLGMIESFSGINNNNWG